MGALAKFKAACVQGRKVISEFPEFKIHGNTESTSLPAKVEEREVLEVRPGCVVFKLPGDRKSSLAWPKASELRQDSENVFRFVSQPDDRLIVKYQFQ